MYNFSTSPATFHWVGTGSFRSPGTVAAGTVSEDEGMPNLNFPDLQAQVVFVFLPQAGLPDFLPSEASYQALADATRSQYGLNAVSTELEINNSTKL